MTTAAPPDLAAELRDLAAWLDDLARGMKSYNRPDVTRRVLREWMSAQAARCEGRAFLALMAIGEAPGQEAGRLTRRPDPATLGGGCEFCPAAGGGCSVCLGR